MTEPMKRLMKTGRVYENDLGIWKGKNPQLAPAGGLRSRRYGCHLLTKQGIQKG